LIDEEIPVLVILHNPGKGALPVKFFLFDNPILVINFYFPFQVAPEIFPLFLQLTVLEIFLIGPFGKVEFNPSFKFELAVWIIPFIHPFFIPIIKF